jgi:pilus assembly protein CpaD
MPVMIWNLDKSVQTAAALALLGLAAAGCSSPMANGPEHALSVERKFPISVEPQMTTIGVRIDPGLQRLDPAEVARVEAFADRWKERGQGAVTVSAPQGSPNQRAGEAAMMQTVSILTKSGVPMHMISRTGYPASAKPGEPPVTLSFMSLSAVSADCASLGWPDNLGFSPRNTVWSSFGCATQNNIAAMVANPRDLAEPQPMGDADATRRLKVIETYRKGQATQTNRKADESGTVSTAAKGEE